MPDFLIIPRTAHRLVKAHRRVDNHVQQSVHERKQHMKRHAVADDPVVPPVKTHDKGEHHRKKRDERIQHAVQLIELTLVLLDHFFISAPCRFCALRAECFTS